MYVKVAWTKAVKKAKICIYSKEALLQKFNETWDARSVLCHRDNMRNSGIANVNGSWSFVECLCVGLGVVLG